MKFISFILFVFTNVNALAAASDAMCVFDHKDYDSPGFSIPYRDGLHIKGHFGCEYICSCKEKMARVMHVLDESHFDMKFSDGTGGPSRAKWFICPFSVRSDSWKPIMTSGEDALLYGAKIVAYQTQIDDTPRPASAFFTPKKTKDVNSAQIKAWAEKECQ